jgi:hypothetical protein
VVLKIALLLLAAASGFQPGQRVLLDAHNCYPEQGHWADRLDRALSIGLPIAIEQDLAWYTDPQTGGQRPVVSHSGKFPGPALRDYFFERVRPIVERALQDPDKSQWPLIVLHFDFKDDVPAHLKSVWELLGQYEGWLTTALKTANDAVRSPLDVKPLLVLTEESNAQEEIFYGQLPVGARMRIFGSAVTRRFKKDAPLPAPAEIVSAPATNYRRWWNNPWSVVERGGQQGAGQWTPAAAKRLKSLVDHAHKLGYWMRFYTLDGFVPPESRGWNEIYNFGSRDAVMTRWKAAIDSGVDLIATDQYEDLAAELRVTR